MNNDILTKEGHSPMKYLRRFVCALALATTAATVGAQEPTVVHSEYGNALDHLLQRPAVAKRFAHKRFGDHLFVETGAGLQYATKYNFLGSDALGRPGFSASLAFGDWLTPEHGWRASAEAGFYGVNGRNLPVGSVHLDYLMNLTAIGNFTYDERARYEVMGVVGVGLNASRLDGDNRIAPSVRFGLRGQWNICPLGYAYIEPRVSLTKSDVLYGSTAHTLTPTMGLYAGVGYHLLTAPRRATGLGYADYSLGANLFYSMSVGLNTLGRRPFDIMDEYRGIEGRLSVGKWLTPKHGVRLSGKLTRQFSFGTHGCQPKSAILSGEYLLNLHNLFGGDMRERKFSINALAGGHLGYRRADADNEIIIGAGGGLQANMRLTSTMDFFLEPRLDAYQGRYMPHHNTFRRFDIMPSLLAGLTFHNAYGRLLGRNNSDAEAYFADFTPHTFVEATMGAGMGLNGSSIRDIEDYTRLQSRLGIGYWFDAVNGARLWMQTGLWQRNGSMALKHATVGADYMLNITNALYGYREQRPLELNVFAGLNAAVRSGENTPYLGAQGGVKGLWNVTPAMSLFLEPQMGLYSKSFIADRGNSAFKGQLVAQVLAGVQWNWDQINYASLRQRFLEDETSPRSFIGVAGGTSVSLADFRLSKLYGMNGSLSYGEWYAPAQAWRLSLNGLAKFDTNPGRLGEVNAAADWMLSLSTLAHGYNPDRLVDIRGFAGVALGADYGSGRGCFTPNIHAGAQMALRLNNHLALTLEPQLVYKGGNRYEGRIARIQPAVLFGVEIRK